MSEVLAAEFKAQPYWWDAAPLSAGSTAPLPARADAVVVGSGFTGLSAALALARAGREVAVIEAGAFGEGASTRNNGALVPYLYLKLDELQARFGAERGTAIARTAIESLEHCLAFLRGEGIECGLAEYQRYFLALTPAHFRRLAQLAALYPRHGIDVGWEALSTKALAAETGLEHYAGAVVARRSLGLHPGLYHAALLARVRAAGATLIDRTRVTRVVPGTEGLRVETTRGRLTTRSVVVATNGYSGPEFPWIRRRLISVRVFKAASEPLADELRERWFPAGRFFTNTRLNHTVLRLTPDGRRVIVGGRAGMTGGNARTHAMRLHADMAELIPALGALRLTHCWDCRMGFTFDKLPFAGEHAGIHYAVGFCGVGITLGGWLGKRMGERILGWPAAPTPYEDRPFPTRPLYWGQGWAVSAALAWFNLKERLLSERRI